MIRGSRKNQVQSIFGSILAAFRFKLRRAYRFWILQLKRTRKSTEPDFCDYLIKDPPQIKDRKRLVYVVLFLLVLFSLLIVQFYHIQIVEGAKWSKKADRQHLFVVTEPFHRGRFISNTSIKKGHPETPQSFVVDVLKYHLHIDPESIPDQNKDAIAKGVIASLKLPVAAQLDLRKQFDRKSRNRKLAMWLEKERKDAIMAWWLPYSRKYKIPRNALFFVTDYQRSYPYGKLLGQVLHTIQSIKDDKTNQAIPTGGLELYFNDYLKGKAGKKRLMRSPRNEFEMGEEIVRPENGADIYLTINHCLQAIAEEELAKGVKKCKAKGGWAAMMDPRTGEILALAQYPFFNPPEYKSYFNNKEMIEHTKMKTVTDANEPGSVMKAVTAAVALKANQELRRRGEAPLFDIEEKINCSNTRFPGRSKPIVDTHLHPFLNMYMALWKSSNVYYARLMERVVNRLGSEWYREVLHDTFGFGKRTNIELPSESPGLLPTPGKKHPNGVLEWSVPTPFSLAMGYNIQVTSLQLLRAFAVFVNGGYLVQPTIIRKIVRTDEHGKQEILLDNTSTDRIQKFPKVLDDEVCQEVIKGIKYTTKSGGSGRRAEIWGYTEAGKSGTAKKILNGVYQEELYVSSFIGFTPVKEPAFVLVVSMNEPEYGFVSGAPKHHGGVVSAPVFREIARRSLEYLGIPPDDPYGYAPSDPRYDANKADWIPEIRRLKEIYEKWNIPTSK